VRIDDPEVIAEVREVFDRYEAALMANETAVLDAIFWADPRTVRFGIAEILYGHEAIRAFRASVRAYASGCSARCGSPPSGRTWRRRTWSMSESAPGWWAGDEDHGAHPGPGLARGFRACLAAVRRRSRTRHGAAPMSTPHVVVIGAGIVGAATALGALREGFRVTILEPGEPGGEQAQATAMAAGSARCR
jgi:hypothetical protein